MPSDVDTAARPRRTHPLTVIGGFAAFGLGLLLDLATQGVGLQTAVTLFGALQMAEWWFKTYELGPAELVVREGVFRRRQHVVPYRRLQQIDVRRSFLMQLFGVAALNIETAGSQEGSVNLALLDLATAERIRATALARRNETTAGAAARGDVTERDWRPPAESSVFEIDGGQLVVAGLLSPGPVLAATTALVLSPLLVASAIRYTNVAVALAAAAVGVVAAAAALSAIATVLAFGGYRLAVAGDELRLTHGVFDKKHVTMPRARVQHIQVVDNPVQRAFGYASIRVRSAARLGRTNEGSGRLDIPILRRSAIPQFLAGLMGEDSWTPPPLEPRPRLARRRAIVRRVALLAAPAVAATAMTPWAGAVALAAAGGLGARWGVEAHRRAGSGVTAAITAFAAGVVVHEMHLVPIARIQSARTIQSPLQRRAGLATIALDIAGRARAPSLYDAAADRAGHLRATVPLASRVHASNTT